MRNIQHSFVVLALAVLVGCAQLGLKAPESFRDKAAVAYSTVTQVRQTTTSLLNAKKITSADAANVLTATDAARAGVDVALQMHATDANAASAKLDAIKTTLTALLGYLATKGT